VDVRLIVATHRDLTAEVRAGRFRDDLYFRIHVVPIHLPPLRERREDVEPMARLFLDRLSRDLSRSPRDVSSGALDRLRSHHWPGNVRELENLMERLLVLGDDGPISVAEVAELLPSPVSVDTSPISSPSPAGVPTAAPPSSAVPASLSLPEQERRLLVEALERVGQNQTRAATLLKISREQLRTRMKRYGLLRPTGRTT
jgi:DNA-binding NtrC family response regulator